MKKKTLDDYCSLADYDVDKMDKIAIRNCHALVKECEWSLQFGSKNIPQIFDENLIEEEYLPYMRSTLVNRMNAFFKDAAKVYSSEFVIWDSYIKFCKTNYRNSVLDVYREYMDKHGKDRPDVLCDALRWIEQIDGTEEEMQDFFIDAYMIQPNSMKLHTTYFDILLKQLDPEADNAIIYKRLLAVVDSSTEIDSIDPVEPLVSFLLQCEDRRYSERTIVIQQKILSDMMSISPMKEEVWNVLAQRELNGQSMCDISRYSSPPKQIDIEDFIAVDDQIWDIRQPINTNLIMVKAEDRHWFDNARKFHHPFDDLDPILEIVQNIWRERPLELRIELCCIMYRKAIETLKTEKMMNLYIDAMLKLHKDRDQLSELKYLKLLTAYKQGHEMALLSENHYVELTKRLVAHKSTIHLFKEILPIGMRRHKSPKLYNIMLSNLIKQNDLPLIRKYFREAVNTLNADQTVDLYKMIIQYYNSLPSKYSGMCQQLYKEACQCSHPAFEEFRLLYLDWCSIFFDLDKIRSQYDEMTQLQPPSLKLHQNMMEIETLSPTLNHQRIRLIHENAIRDFGKTNGMVWIDYLAFEKVYGDPTIVPPLYERAQRDINPELLEGFDHGMITFSYMIGQPSEPRPTQLVKKEEIEEVPRKRRAKNFNVPSFIYG